MTHIPSEYEIRRDALMAATGVLARTFTSQSREPQGLVRRDTLALADEYATWLRQGVSTGAQELAAAETALHPLGGANASQEASQPLTVDEVWGTERCSRPGCGHLASVHTRDGKCYAASLCPCAIRPDNGLTL